MMNSVKIIAEIYSVNEREVYVYQKANQFSISCYHFTDGGGYISRVDTEPVHLRVGERVTFLGFSGKCANCGKVHFIRYDSEQ